MEYVSPEGLRLDGRRPPELRQLRCEVGVLESADGSACFQMGNTKVMAVVYGPHEIVGRAKLFHDRARVQCKYSMAAFSTAERRRRTRGDRRSIETSLAIKQTMEAVVLTHLMPRSQIDIYVQVLETDGGTRSACINAATLALADAGIPMRDLVAACAAGYLNGTPLIDMNSLEETGGGPDLTVGLQPKLDKVSLLQMDSRLPIDVFEKTFNLAMDGCKAIGAYMRQQFVERAGRRLCPAQKQASLAVMADGRDCELERCLGQSGAEEHTTASVCRDHGGEEQEKPTTFSRVTLEELRSRLGTFARDRDWEQYHAPRNLLLALVGEVGELSEIFQWRGEVPKGLPGWSEKEREHVGEELSDVLLYLVRLADSCDIDLGAAALRKLRLNEAKYPADKCRGSSKKYTAYKGEYDGQNGQRDNNSNSDSCGVSGGSEPAGV
ncbi:hypothetical protein CBR_g46394 [Chara braunii]|uniref:Uncharacterized protein n=1 Tax=Chara braunii TaxID=69332 RepID=A0A388M0L6_CHABU|nr:hypothetical protein CBR_g46394 [Chara braunii]|eukprot:GBG88023.1 hypothetical protein CBR_g46394 [Chara braunii]